MSRAACQNISMEAYTAFFARATSRASKILTVLAEVPIVADEAPLVFWIAPGDACMLMQESCD
jgi:hypothetical protein